MCSSYTNGWLTGITDAGAGSCPGGTSLAVVSYHPNGMVYQVDHGNGVRDTYAKDPNDIGRPSRISTANAVSNWDSGRFEYDGAGNIKAPRGMLEPVARPGPTGQQYSYDAFGNLQRIDLNGVTYQDLATSTSSNRLIAAGYDPAGNMTAWGGYTYGYDPLNAMTTLSGGTLNTAYRYDADGERIAFREGASGPWTYSLRGLDGKVLREYSLNGSTWSWGKDVVYRNGQLLASIDSAGTRHFTLDHLGSPRLITDSGRNVVEYHAYWGYGQEIDTAAGTERMKFTGHERDNLGTAGTLDYMHARYYNPTIGRFLAVDPGSATPKDPKTWNRYGYARANPVTFRDQDGAQAVEAFLLGAGAAAGPTIAFTMALTAPSPRPGMNNAQWLGQSLADLGTILAKRRSPNWPEPASQRRKGNPSGIEDRRVATSGRGSAPSNGDRPGGSGLGPVITGLTVKTLDFVPGSMIVVKYAIVYRNALAQLSTNIWTGGDTIVEPAGGSSQSVPPPAVEPGQSFQDFEEELLRQQLGSAGEFIFTTSGTGGA